MSDSCFFRVCETVFAYFTSYLHFTLFYYLVHWSLALFVFVLWNNIQVVCMYTEFLISIPLPFQQFGRGWMSAERSRRTPCPTRICDYSVVHLWSHSSLDNAIQSCCRRVLERLFDNALTGAPDEKSLGRFIAVAEFYD